MLKVIKDKISSKNANLLYAGLQARLLSSLIDCIIIGLLLMPIFAVIGHFIYGDTIPGEVIQSVLKEAEQLTQENQNFDATAFIKNNQQLQNYFIKKHGLMKMILDQSIQFIILLTITLFFWIKKQATPGKRILSLKIVDADTLGKPSLKQFIIRAISYLISILPIFLGIIWIAFDPKKQAWHDKIAKTLVIKEKNNA